MATLEAVEKMTKPISHFRYGTYDAWLKEGTIITPPLKVAKRSSAAHSRNAVASTLRARESALFRPVRSIGAVIDSLPFSLQPLGDTSFLTVSVRALVTVGETIITALKLDIVVWHKLTEVGRFRGHHGSATVLSAVGSTYLLSAANHELILWQLSDIGKLDAETSIEDASGKCILSPLGRPKLGKDFGDVSCICHPPTYLNKVLVGGSGGQLELWNIRSMNRIHTFQCLATAEGAPISTMKEANALDVVAVGFATGRIVLMNELQQAQGRVTCLSFRSDDGSMPQLVSGAPTGDFIVWDLEKRRMHHLREAHGGPITAAQFLPKEPLLSPVKMWIFDTADGMSIPSLSEEYSQGSLKKMGSKALEGGSHRALPPVIDVAACQALSTTVLTPPVELNGGSAVSAVAVSSCGNYCVLGLENGALHRFNVQSGLHRGNIPKMAEGEQDPDSFGVKAPVARRSATSKAPAAPPKAHHGRVCGIIVTNNAQVASISSHPKDCCLKLWKLGTHEFLEEISLAKGSSCTLMRDFGALIAVCLGDGSLPICDLNSKSVVRSFHCGVPATDLAFAPDGRWLAVSLCDGGLRVFDLPAARCIDAFIFAQPALGLCFSPSGAYLLTSHAKNNAIQVWANKFLFDPSLSAPLLRPEPEVPINVEEPGPPEDGEAEDSAEEMEDDHITPSLGQSSTTPLDTSLLTLSDVPPAKVLATLHLDLVKERNKLKEPPKPLPNAPFFLPTAHEGVTPRFAAPLGEEENDAAVEPARPSLFEELTKANDGAASDLDGTFFHSLPFQTMLRKKRYDKALEFLKSQTPSGVHLALEQIGPMASGDEEELAEGGDLLGKREVMRRLADYLGMSCALRKALCYDVFRRTFMAPSGAQPLCSLVPVQESAEKEEGEGDKETVGAPSPPSHQEEEEAEEEEEEESEPINIPSAMARSCDSSLSFCRPRGHGGTDLDTLALPVQGATVEIALLEGEEEEAYWEETNRTPEKLKEAFDNPKGKGKDGKGKKGKGPQSLLALNEAVKLNAATLVKSLIEADANPQLKDGPGGQGETAIECAGRLKLSNILELLELDSCKKKTMDLCLPFAARAEFAKDFQQGLSLIQNVPLFANMHPSEYPRLAAAFTTRNCVKDEVIVKEGECISELLQRVDILKHLTNDEKAGWSSLWTMTFYQDETIIQRRARLWRRSGKSQHHLDVIAQLKPTAIGPEALCSAPCGGPKAMVKYELRALKQIGLIGCGGFGTVTLQRCTISGNIFALKTLSKGRHPCRDHANPQSNYVEWQSCTPHASPRQELSVLNEKSVLRMTQSPFIIRLAATFNGESCLLSIRPA
eukprot:Skav202126  [mRNA]  locus=scaffold1980:224830:255469:+ [translate_table: standard]